jgi:hypothetical protein
MTAGDANPAAAGPHVAPRLRWFHFIILIALLAAGAALRFHDLTKIGLWPDEFWSSVHMASGRGNSVLALPSGVLFNPPPQTELRDAPHWWHIWTGLDTILHPPLYLILLRWWMDVFGTSDVSTRCFSTVASLASVVVLFEIVRKSVSPGAGLMAAAIMALAPIQINLSVESRPYTLLALLGLLACHALLRIERRGASPLRLVLLATFAAATALTHYFSLGALLAIGGYALVRLRGTDRRKTVLALCASALFVLVAWGPFILRQHGELATGQKWAGDPNPRTASVLRAIAAPSVFLYGGDENKSVWIAPAVIAYLLPLLLMRRQPQLLLWWLWIVGIIGSLFCYDLARHSRLLEIVKYISLAAPATYAICTAPLPIRGGWRWTVPGLIVASVGIAVIERMQEGPPDIYGDWRGLAVRLDHRAAAGDPIVFYPNLFWGSPGMYYLDFAHYAPDSTRPIMYLREPADDAALRQLKPYRRIWLVGPAPSDNKTNLLPGWRAVSSQWFLASGGFVEMVPADNAVTSASQPASRPTGP